MASLFIQPFLDVGAGITPADGALLLFKVVGSGTDKDTFTTAAGDVAHANPVVANALGVFPAIYVTGDYDWILQDKNAVQKDTGSFSEFLTATSKTTSAISHTQAGTDYNLATYLGNRHVVNVLDHGGVADNETDNYAAIVLAMAAAVASGSRRVYFPGALLAYKTFTEIEMETEGLIFCGDGMGVSIINQPSTGFSGDATINVTSGRNQALENISVYALNGGTKEALRITNGQYFSLKNVLIKNGVYGIHYIAGNAQRWWNVLVESADTGIAVIPSSGDNTNGGTYMGIRCYNCADWGLDIQQGDGATGSMHGMWNLSSEEGADGGIRVRGGQYNWMHFYTEQNTGDDFDLDPAAANYYFLANPDNGEDGALLQNSFFGAGVYSTGSKLITDNGLEQGRVFEKDFAVSGSLAGVGIDIHDITNSSGGTLALTLTFLTSMRIGTTVRIHKSDATSGFTLTTAGSVVLEGDTSTFGASPKGTAVLEVTKYSDTKAVCVQWDRASYDVTPEGKTSAALDAVGNNINTTDKVAGKMVYNSTLGYNVYASGGGTTDVWKKVSDDTTANTPA